MPVTSNRSQAQNKRGLAKANKNLADVLGDIRLGGKDGLADVGVVVTNRIRQALSTKGTGRVYRRGRVLHQASAPGQPPAVDTGRLRSSYTYKTGVDARGAYVDIGTNVEYAPFLEFGTRRMAPRPHLRPSINEVRHQITKLIRDGIIDKQRGTIRRLPKEIQ